MKDEKDSKAVKNDNHQESDYKEKLLTLKEAAKYLRMSPASLYRKAGKQISGYKPSGKWLFTIDQLDDYLN